MREVVRAVHQAGAHLQERGEGQVEVVLLPSRIPEAQEVLAEEEAVAAVAAAPTSSQMVVMEVLAEEVAEEVISEI